MGGKILDLMLKRMNMFGRIAACGTTSNYNSDADITGIKNFYVSGLHFKSQGCEG